MAIGGKKQTPKRSSGTDPRGLDLGRQKMEMRIYEAVSINELTYVKEALARDHGDIPTEDLHLALITAAARGHTDCLKELLHHNVSVMAVDGDYSTALIVAAGKGHTDIVKIMIEHGCPVNYQNALGFSALMKACESNHIEVVEVLIDHGADECERDNMSSYSVMRSIPYGYTSLMLTALQGADCCKDMMALLIKAKVPLEAADSEGRTVLHYAARHCKSDVMELLLQAGADINAQDIWGMTPLMQACAYNKKDNVAVMLNKGADVSIQCKAQRSALSKAVRTGCKEIVEMLIRAGCCIFHMDVHGKTPLHVALSHHNYAAVKCLLQVLTTEYALNLHFKYFNTYRTVNSFEYAVDLHDLCLMQMLYEAGAATMKQMYQCSHNDQVKNKCADKPDVMEYLLSLVTRPRSLASSCRIIVRKSLHKPIVDSVERLPLPKYLREYLLYSDIQY